MATRHSNKLVASTRSTQTSQAAVTFTLAASVCPNEQVAAAIANRFALNPVDYAALREAAEEMIGSHARLLADTVNEKAMAIHLQRLVGALVGSAHSAGRFYSQKVTEARDLTSRLANDARDEDRDGPLGFDSKAQRARQFAAELGLQAYTFLAAAEGAVDAFAAVTGEDWKPYQRAPMNADTVSSQSATAELAAFGG